MSGYQPIVSKTPTRMGAFDERDTDLIRYLGLNPAKPEDRAAVAVCRHYGFDPLLKHVVVIPRSGVYITRDGLLHVAHRSGQLDGIVVEQEPVLDGERGEWVARVSVWRKDMSHPFTYPGRYPANGGNDRYAPEMALKAAEAHALRRAFEVAGLPALDEQREPANETPHTGRSFADVSGDAEQPASKAAESHRRKWLNRMFALLHEVDCNDREDQLIVLRHLTGRDLEHRDDLTDEELREVVHTLNDLRKRGNLSDRVTEILNTAAIAAEEQLVKRESELE
ncbi:hypothetical protein [Mycobacterium xenopi]|uniref:RecT-family phage protein n=1 Tax=Mycobacterium xenopi TaxID=1789 RepID=A0AAD1GZN6_MYCXE|nr:hypothetical protein [Mycobacterium xenopi]BBU22137.1 hypothetical protein MYXE_19270 [Mycobacterium xenopi]SPX77975.1 RecT-family phage protein [Mycobacterium xenopi]